MSPAGHRETSAHVRVDPFLTLGRLPSFVPVSRLRVRIRPATRRDIPDLVRSAVGSVALGDGLGPGGDAADSTFAGTRRLETAWTDPNRFGGKEVFVAERDEGVVGYVSFETKGSGIDLTGLGVPRGLRGRGIGSQLVRFVEARASAERRSAVSLRTRVGSPPAPSSSVSWWLHQGYEASGPESPAGDHTAGELRMRKLVPFG